jgi:hypothetical protein
LVLALTGLTTLVVAAGASTPKKAIVRSVHGKVMYRMEKDGEWKPLRVNVELMQGAELKSDPGAEAYLQVNGFTSTVKLTESTQVTLDKMLGGAGFGGDTSTDMKLDGGQVLGSVRKLSANSDYTVSVPNGVAGIRGTDFSVTVTVQPNGNFTVTFTSVTGTIVCQVTPPPTPGNPTSATLQTGQSWTVTGTINAAGVATTATVGIPAETPPQVQQSIVNIIAQTQNIVTTAITVTTTPPPPPVNHLPPVNDMSMTGGSGGP